MQVATAGFQPLVFLRHYRVVAKVVTKGEVPRDFR